MIEAKKEIFWQSIDRDAKLEPIATGFGIAEGPLFSRIGFLLFSDIRNSRIHRFERGKVSVFREHTNNTNGLTFDHQGRLLACEKGRVTRTEKNGSITVLASDGLQGPNDLVYSIDGSVYFTDLPKARVYQITRDRSGVGGTAERGTVRVVAEDCTGPNGVALAPDQRKLYIADMRGNLIRVYAIAPDGTLNDSRVFAPLAEADGIKTDEAGNVWAAGAESIAVFDPRGELLGTVKTPEQPTNLNWGAGFRGLYVTTRTSVYYLAARAHGTRTY